MSMLVRIDSGEDKPHHDRPLLVITGERPDPDVLAAMLQPYLDNPPWANKAVRIVGYTLGGTYRGWLVPCPGAQTIRSDFSLEYGRLFHRDGVDAVRISDLQTAEFCWKRWAVDSKQPRQRKMRYRNAPRCNVLVARTHAKSNDLAGERYDDPWRCYWAVEADRPHARWLNINEGSCDDTRTAALIDQIPPSCWLAVVDYWTKYRRGQALPIDGETRP